MALKKTFRLMTSPVFGKTMEARDIKLGRTYKKGNQLVSEANCYTTNGFQKIC